MKLFNPTKNTLEIQYKGIKYSVRPTDSTDVPDNVATFWLSIHGFLQMSEDKVVEIINDEKLDESTVEIIKEKKIKKQ